MSRSRRPAASRSLRSADVELVMHEFSRRDVISMAASVAAGSGLANVSLAADGADMELVAASGSPQSYMLVGPETFRIEGDGFSRDLIITSARDRDGKPTPVRIPSNSMRIFRADADVDEFTKQGGLYWRFHNTEGKVTLKSPGEIVMVVREGYDTIRCFIMKHDLRC